MRVQRATFIVIAWPILLRFLQPTFNRYPELADVALTNGRAPSQKVPFKALDDLCRIRRGTAVTPSHSIPQIPLYKTAQTP
jgi:hypothetical protein